MWTLDAPPCLCSVTSVTSVCLQSSKSCWVMIYFLWCSQVTLHLFLSEVWFESEVAPIVWSKCLWLSVCVYSQLSPVCLWIRCVDDVISRGPAVPEHQQQFLLLFIIVSEEEASDCSAEMGQSEYQTVSHHHHHHHCDITWWHHTMTSLCGSVHTELLICSYLWRLTDTVWGGALGLCSFGLFI